MSFEFEGDEVSDFVVQLPAATLDADEAYTRGTLMTLNVQVRVKSVRIEEDRKGNLIRKHILVMEEASIRDVLTPERRRELIALAEAEALREYTVQEEPEATDDQATDEIPGQLTVDEVLAEQAGELADTYARTHTAPEGDKWATGAFPVDTAAFTDAPTQEESIEEDVEVIPAAATATDDDDPEHAWMDEEDDGKSGVQVVIVGNDRYAVDF